MVLLEVKKLIKRFSGRTVVDSVSFHVNQGEIVGLLGRNGAGKTTTFRMVVGMIDPAGGEVVFDGVNVTRLPMYQRARRGMGYLSQEPSVFQRLTVQENLLAILETMPMSKRQRIGKSEELMDQFGLNHLAPQEARTLSGGERRKLEIARALITDPQLILLDEPFSGVDPLAVEDLQREIVALRAAKGLGVLLTDHNVRETLAVTDRSYIIDEGKNFRDGSPRDLINDPLVRKAYLGQSFRGDEFDDQQSRLSAAHV